jgi:hypothetical protein
MRGVPWDTRDLNFIFLYLYVFYNTPRYLRVLKDKQMVNGASTTPERAPDIHLIRSFHPRLPSPRPELGAVITSADDYDEAIEESNSFLLR